MWDEVRIKALEAQTLELRRQMKLASDWHNTLRSPWYKRVWWWLQGYRVSALGTWYHAPWNRSNAQKYDRGF